MFGELVDSFRTKGGMNYLVLFRCGETIQCAPPMVEGELDRAWKRQKPPAPKDQAAWEKYIGMKLQPI